MISVGWQLNKAFNKYFIDIRLSYIAAHTAFAKEDDEAIKTAAAAINKAEASYREGMRPLARAIHEP